MKILQHMRENKSVYKQQTYSFFLFRWYFQTRLFVFPLVLHNASMGGERGMYRVLVGKPEGKRPLASPRPRWVDNIRTDLQEVGCGYMDWTGLAQDRDRWRTLMSAVMNLPVP